MFFTSIEEKSRVETIASRLSLLSEEGYSATFENCVMVASNEFEETFGEEAWDIITLTGLALYDRAMKNEKCRRVIHCKYRGETAVVYYRVIHKKRKALFEIEKIQMVCELI